MKKALGLGLGGGGLRFPQQFKVAWLPGLVGSL